VGLPVPHRSPSVYPVYPSYPPSCVLLPRVLPSSTSTDSNVFPNNGTFGKGGAPQPVERNSVPPGNQKICSSSPAAVRQRDRVAFARPPRVPPGLYPTPRELRELLLFLRPDEEGSSSLAARVCRGRHYPDEIGDGRRPSEYAPKAGRPVRYGPLRSSARTSGRSVMMPSTPWPSRRRMSASESMVHTSTRSPRSWAARMNPGVTTRSPW
jgi:hypothetical protein